MISESISEKDQILYLCGGLGSDYNFFVVLVTSNTNFVTFDGVVSILTVHESCLEQQQTIDEMIKVCLYLLMLLIFNSRITRKFSRIWTHHSRINFIQIISCSCLYSIMATVVSMEAMVSFRGDAILHFRSHTWICSNFGHIAMSCYQWFDINF